MRTQFQYNLGLKFSDTAEMYSAKIAIKYPDGRSLTYKELEILSNRFVAFLLSKGLKKGSVVVLFNEKSPESFALMIACLKIGIIYCNVDPLNPKLRLKAIFERCNPDLVLSDVSKTNLPEGAVNFIGAKFYSISELSSHADFSNPTHSYFKSDSVHGNDAAYIMFTSGSTGFPKGAVITHNNVLNFINWGITKFEITDKDSLTNINPVYFDNSVFDFYLSLFSGATLVPLNRLISQQPRMLVDAVNETKCTVWFSVPSLLIYLLRTGSFQKTDLSGITRLVFGGEGFPKNQFKELYSLFSDRIAFYNVYGPTECTCICSTYRVRDEDIYNRNNLLPLGYIADNFEYQIHGLNSGNDNIGELILFGPNIGAGYYNDPERTAVSFVQTAALYRQIGYKTGDLVSKDNVGMLHFHGRADHQIKHMGYRIELGEIEAAFYSINYVREACVIYEKVPDRIGQIKAYISTDQIHTDDKTIFSALKQILPHYMIPNTISVLPSLPKNSNGKIDRIKINEL